ncbi:MAG TPA: SDR family oxidoreductase [Acidimicrobiia bacterium]|nr:SDR family oxidoreductase [Acidimicrobiia bacterium]
MRDAVDAVPISERLGLEGRAFLVAGAGGGGIGTAVCRLLAEVGAVVGAVDLGRQQLVAAERAVAEAGGEMASLVADVREPDQVNDVVTNAVEMIGPLSGLVHVAGGLLNRWSSVLSTTPDTFDDIVRFNLHAPFLTSQAVARHMAEHDAPGSIVHISSIAGLASMPFGAGYGAGKAGLMALMRTQAVELGARGIRVNAVACGTIRTPRSDTHAAAPEDTEAERAAIPLGRRGRPEDIAGAVLFLLSDLAAFVSGHVLVVDGASSAKPSYLDADNLPVFVHDDALRDRLRGS